MKSNKTASSVAKATKSHVAEGRKKPPISSPTPTPDQLGDLATAMVQRSSTSKTNGSSISKKQKSSTAKSHRNRKKEIFATVGHHDEIDKDATGTSSSNNNSSGRRKTKKSAASLLSPSSLSSQRASPSDKPPLISRYCGCCGDILSTKAYGFDERNRDRRCRFHPNDGIGQCREKVQAAAESVKQLLMTASIKPKSVSGKNLKSTKASRKKKKPTKAQDHNQDYLKNLPQWPEESLRMDMTIIEGLLSLKRTPKEEVKCACWRDPGASKEAKRALALASSTLRAKSKKTKVAKGVGKGKTVVKKKSSITKTNSVGAPIIPGTATIKTVIVKCPKTGKKIKKTVRVVKKLVKKKRVVPKLPTGTAPVAAAGEAAAAPKGGTATLPVAAPVAIAIKKKVLDGSKENRVSPDTAASKVAIGITKKRSRENSVGGRDDDGDDISNSSDDGSGDFSGGASLKKRRRNDEKADLELRDRLMSCPLDNGPLVPSQRELMELTTIRKRNALQTFYKRFNELRQFIVIFGDANVPQQFPENHSLGIWVNKMRMERKKWDTGSERTSLTERKIELLESIDFIWAQNHKGEIGWERRFQEIKKFKRKHGHCNVPTKSAENRALGRWVSTQRTMYKNYMKGFVGKSLTREEQERRIFLLLEEGFLFSMIPNGQNPNGTDADGTGTGEPNEEGTVPMDTTGVEAIPASHVDASMGLVAPPAATSAKDNAASAVSIGAAIMMPTPAMTEPIPTSVKAVVSANAKSTAPSTSTDPKATIVEKGESSNQEKHNPVPDPKRNCGSGSDAKTEEGANQKDTEPVPSSPSRNPETRIPKPEATTTIASSPSASRAVSVAQVSITTTPTTLLSVSTTPSPEKSPAKTDLRHGESDRVEVKAEAATDKIHPVEETVKDENHATTGDQSAAAPPKPKPKEPVAANIKVERCAENARDTPDAVSKQSSDDDLSTKTETTNDESRHATKIESVGKSSPSPAKTMAISKENELSTETKEPTGASEALPVTSESEPADRETTPSVLSTAVLPKKEPEPDAKAGLLSTESSTNQTPPTMASAKPRELSPAEPEPKLVTSDGMRIIVRMSGPDNENGNADQQALTPRRGTEHSLVMATPSPSRRSVRARKPSARQLEAEKSPLRESILGR